MIANHLIEEEGTLIYVNTEGLWFRCACLRRPLLIHPAEHPVVTLTEMRELIERHGHH